MRSAKKKAGRSATQRNRRGESTRTAILAAAHELLQTKGFEAVSIDRVAKAAGVTRSSIYHQFHGRDEFLLYLIAESLRRLQRERVPNAEGSALDRFVAEAEAGFGGDPNLLRMFYQLVFDRRSKPREVEQLLREAYGFRTRRLAAGLRGDGLPEGEAETLALVLAAAFDGLYARRLIDLGPAEVHRALAMLAELVERRAGGRRRIRGEKP